MTASDWRNPSRLIQIRVVAIALALTVSACSHLCKSTKPEPASSAPRAQLSIGYSLLYQEADGIPKLKWLLRFKDKSSDMGQFTDDLITYYEELAERMTKLSQQYPGMRIDVAPMSQIEADARKSIGTDQAKDMAPLVGKSGLEFEREALLMFYDALNEQRHLVAVMLDLETDPGLKRVLESTKAQLDTRYSKAGALLSHHYFTH